MLSAKVRDDVVKQISQVLKMLTKYIKGLFIGIGGLLSGAMVGAGYGFLVGLPLGPLVGETSLSQSLALGGLFFGGIAGTVFTVMTYGTYCQLSIGFLGRTFVGGLSGWITGWISFLIWAKIVPGSFVAAPFISIVFPLGGVISGALIGALGGAFVASIEAVINKTFFKAVGGMFFSVISGAIGGILIALFMDSPFVWLICPISGAIGGILGVWFIKKKG